MTGQPFLTALACSCLPPHDTRCTAPASPWPLARPDLPRAGAGHPARSCSTWHSAGNPDRRLRRDGSSTRSRSCRCATARPVPPRHRRWLSKHRQPRRPGSSPRRRRCAAGPPLPRARSAPSSACHIRGRARRGTRLRAPVRRRCCCQRVHILSSLVKSSAATCC